MNSLTKLKHSLAVTKTDIDHYLHNLASFEEKKTFDYGPVKFSKQVLRVRLDFLEKEISAMREELK